MAISIFKKILVDAKVYDYLPFLMFFFFQVFYDGVLDRVATRDPHICDSSPLFGSTQLLSPLS